MAGLVPKEKLERRKSWRDNERRKRRPRENKESGKRNRDRERTRKQRRELSWIKCDTQPFFTMTLFIMET